MIAPRLHALWARLGPHRRRRRRLAPETAADFGLIIAGVGDLLYALCRAMQTLGLPRDQIVALLDAVIADARLAEGNADTRRTLVAEAVRAGMLGWDDAPPTPRARLQLLDGGKAAPLPAPRPSSPAA